ncbi:transmembrane protein, putative (macronuclear) [Tetrahymena thermophila SB210]|uniref:Transmembrane protein, putative n=1 Tax=Tetrahymena thermophila (strain SB210) TaxID=312017 RepID=W7XIA5_TETTS|nr:transmembrane protein, putative [Tetrahymena thermophila SB210]EWS73129.1 transmembrane protein, putative [Tetrahymena thermophila SB210]|eukprot:XP_012654316.1 transmembrane protein, putative [Tetrahymena thermophila SB210]
MTQIKKELTNQICKHFTFYFLFVCLFVYIFIYFSEQHISIYNFQKVIYFVKLLVNDIMHQGEEGKINQIVGR